jgi:hypothetical protein
MPCEATMSDYLTAPEVANLLAAQAVAASTSYLEERGDGARLAQEANRLFLELQMIGHDPACNSIADPTRLLVVAMMRTACATGPRAERWADIMRAFVPLLRQESNDLAATGVQRT